MITTPTPTKEQIADVLRRLRERQIPTEPYLYGSMSAPDCADGADLIEALAARLAEAQLQLDGYRHSEGADCHALRQRALTAEAAAALARETVALILPLAKGYAAAHQIGSNAAYIAQAEAFLKSTPSAPVSASAPETKEPDFNKLADDWLAAWSGVDTLKVRAALIGQFRATYRLGLTRAQGGEGRE